MFFSYLFEVDSFTITVALVITAVIFFLISRQGQKYNLPPGPTGIPILGYLPFLGSEPYIKFHELRKRYGNVFGLYLGRVYVIILGDFEAVKEAFSKSSTTDRPEQTFDLIPDGVGFSSVNGEEWVEQRKYSLKAMRNLGLGKSHWETLVEEEIDDFLKMISEHNGQPFDICKLLTASVSNNISSLVFGRRLPMTEQSMDFLYGAVNSVSQFFSQVGVRNFFPRLCNTLATWGVTEFASYYKGMVKLNQFIRNEVKCRKESSKDESFENFIDGYLLEIKNNEENGLRNSFNFKNLHGNVQALFIGASDTTRTSIYWLLLAMASELQIQENVQKEIDEVLGRDKVKWSERTNLPLTNAVIMESQRRFTIAPLNTSRIAMEDITIGGYDIPKGTTIIANYWGVHNDETYWKEPEKFLPERFLSADGKDVNLKPESYLPFSYGKRNCPGETVAMIEILYYFVSLMQNFQVLPPEGVVPKLQGTLGLTYQAVPQKLRFVKRRNS